MRGPRRSASSERMTLHDQERMAIALNVRLKTVRRVFVLVLVFLSSRIQLKARLTEKIKPENQFVISLPLPLLRLKPGLLTQG